jgi:hypothetical protein
MNKVLLGILVGAVLGAFDGATAWFTPEVRNAIVGIMIGSTIKGLIAGAAAGWFANKVQSVPKGIVFGLVVGAVLAFAVCQMQGGKYYMEIMLPGSIVGAIVGWATQRYGRRTAAVMALLFVMSVNAHAGDTITAADAFAKLKSLDGNWSGHVMKADGPPMSLRYRVRSGGTQPSMTLDLAKSSPSQLVFDFEAMHGSGSHVHHGTIRFNGADNLVADWSWVTADGKEARPAKVFYLARAK